MKSDKNKQFYIDKLSQYIDKYGMELDTDTISMMIDMELSDTIFEQHMDSCQKLNLVIIFMQWICVVVNCILLFFRVHIGIAVSIITTLLLIVVLVNNHIHNKTWKQAKERNKCIQELIKLLKLNTRLETIRELENTYDIDFNELQDKLDRNEE